MDDERSDCAPELDERVVDGVGRDCDEPRTCVDPRVDDEPRLCDCARIASAIVRADSARWRNESKVDLRLVEPELLV